MINNSVVIASTADCLANVICEKLHNIHYRGYIASNDKDLFIRINSYYPKYVFIENCFHNNTTYEYVHKIKRTNENLRIVIWTASDIKPFNAARFINAGAESFFSLREKDEIVNHILKQIMLGVTYCPNDVANACIRNTANQIFDKPFTVRELQIIEVMHLSDPDMADELHIKYRNVCYHKEKVFRKLGVNNKAAAIEKAVKLGIISAPQQTKEEKL